MALAIEGRPYLVILEEPEAHLHPRAQGKLVEIIAEAVRKGRKAVVMTTHNDYVLYKFNNLLLKGLLKPELVAAYLVESGDGFSRLVPLEVTEEGVPEDEFSKIAEELADERAEALKG